MKPKFEVGKQYKALGQGLKPLEGLYKVVKRERWYITFETPEGKALRMKLNGSGYMEICNNEMVAGDFISIAADDTPPMQHGGARQGAGRKPVPDDQKRKARTFYCTEAEYAKLKEYFETNIRKQ